MELFGAEFANMDSKEQGLFFKGLAKELMTWKSSYSRQMQFSYTADKLSKTEKTELENALTILWYEE